MSRGFFPGIGLLVVMGLTGCQVPAGPEVVARHELIRAEPPGDYWIGRRVAVERTRFWGYVRRPRQLWEQAQLVVLNEREKLAPDRLPETPGSGGLAFQYDHNREYRMRGYLSGRQVYDPNSDKILPEFVLQGIEEVNARPGWLFHPREKRDAFGVPQPPR
jgi:hypothetical protein